MRTLGIFVGLSLGACSAIPVEPEIVPSDLLSEKQRSEVEDIVSDIVAVVELETREVRSRPEIYDFLLTEMVFTAGVVRAMGQGDWKIARDPERPDPNVFWVDDPAGMRLRFELLGRREGTRYYLTHGRFSMGLLPSVEGRTIIVMTVEQAGEVLRTSATVYVRVDSALYALLSTMARGYLSGVVRERSGFFIQAATWVAEESARAPGRLYDQLKNSKEVDQETLEEFRKRFLAPRK